MEDLIKYQLESLSSQRDQLISELIRADYEKTNYISEVAELKNASSQYGFQLAGIWFIVRFMIKKVSG